MVKKRIFILVSLVFLLGCGTSGDLGDLSDTPIEDSKAIVVRGGKEGINYILSPDKRKVRYLGEIENNGKQISCFIDITFSTKGLGPDGNPIPIDLQQGVTRTVNGFTLTNFGEEIPSCLKPGQFGSFDTGDIDLGGEFADFDFKICFRRDGICQSFPLAKDPRVPLSVPDLLLEDNNGMRVFRGAVRNDADPITDPNAIAYDVTIHFTVLNDQDMVIGTAESEPLRAQPCGEIPAKNPTSCIGPGVLTEPFTVNTNTPVTAICPGCFYYRIHHSE